MKHRLKSNELMHKPKKDNPRWAKFKSGLFDGMSKLSKSFMLPIALLPIAGIFIGIGATINNLATDEGAKIFGSLLQTTGSIPFDNMGLLFAIAIAIGYTKDAGVSGLTALVAFLVCNAFISVFLKANISPNNEFTFSGIKDGIDVTLTISYDMSANDFLSSYPKPDDYWDFFKQTNYFEVVDGWTNITLKSISSSTEVMSYNLWFWQGGSAIDTSVTGKVLGINTLSTGVFGGMIIGGITAYLYNKFHTIQLPSAISFFSGVRFVPIVAFFSIMGLSILFILTWPGVGLGINKFGKWSAGLPYGIDSFLFGTISRALEVFGLHHAFYMPLLMTGAGGQLSDFQNAIMQHKFIEMINDSNLTDILKQEWITKVKNISLNMNPTDLSNNYHQLNIFISDQWFDWYSKINPNTWHSEGDKLMYFAIVNDGTLKIQDVWNAGIKVGRYQNGNYALFMFGFPASMLAMYLNVPKENRKQVLGIYSSAALSAFVCGISEPVEFLLLFANPWLFFGILVPANGLNYLLMNVLEVKTAVIFSQGLLDFCIYGILPIASGHDTRFWIILIAGAGWSLVLFFTYYYIIKYKKINIPGRQITIDGDKNNLGELTSKTELKAKISKQKQDRIKGSSSKESKNEAFKKLAIEIIDGYGGVDNIKDVDACITRLRVNVFDSAKIKKEALKNTQGAMGIIDKGTAFHVVYGEKASIIKSYVLEEIEEQTKLELSK